MHVKENGKINIVKYSGKGNENLWRQYSQQTEDIINGLDRCIAPTSSYEMDIRK